MLARRPDFAALAALTLVCAVVFWPLLSGQTYFYGDLQLQFHPWATFWKSQLMQGRVPLWNAGMLGGQPFVGNPQAWVLYPSSLLLWACPAITALALTTWLHLWLGGAFFYFWMRRGALKLEVVPALLGACVWMLCGFFVAKAQFPNMLQSLAWVPAVLWAGEGVAARADARSTLVLGGVLGLQLLAGHAQICLFSFYMLAIYGPYRWFGLAKRPRFWRVILGFAGAGILAGLLAAGQLLSVVEALGATQRQALTIYDASRFAVLPWTLVILVLPYHYGNPMDGSWHYPLRINFWESVMYVGIVPLALALWAVWKERRARFWMAWSLGFLWMACGIFGGLWALGYYVLPGLSRFHDAGRFGVGWSIGAAILAALGAQSLGRAKPRWVWAALFLTVVDLGVFARGVYPFRSVEAAQTPPPAPWGRDAMIEARQARLWQPDFLEVWGYLMPPGDYRLNDTENARQFFQAAPYNRHLLRGWLSESGYDPLYDRATQRRLNSFAWREDEGLPLDIAQRLGRDSIRIVQVFGPRPLPPRRDLTLVYQSTWTRAGRRLFYYRNDAALPRARWLDGATWRAVRIVSENSSSIELDVPARAQTIELADSMRPGWHALEGETILPIQTTIEGWRRLELPRAPSVEARRIRFVYAPTVWKLGVFVSLCALGFGCAGLAATRPKGTS